MNDQWTLSMKVKEMELGRPLEAALREMVERGMSWAEIAEELEVSRVTLLSWRDRLKVDRIKRPTLVTRETAIAP